MHTLATLKNTLNHLRNTKVNIDGKYLSPSHVFFSHARIANIYNGCSYTGIESYRGDYRFAQLTVKQSQSSIEERASLPKSYITIANFLESLEKRDIVGYKGGNYTVNPDLILYVSDWGAVEEFCISHLELDMDPQAISRGLFAIKIVVEDYDEI